MKSGWPEGAYAVHIRAMTRRPHAQIIALLLAAVPFSPVDAQVARGTADAQASAVTNALNAWIALPVAPGRDLELAARLERELPGWSADDNGNLIRRTGRGTPRRVVACALDIPQYVVSQVTDDGYLRLHRAGNAFRRHDLWDQFHEAQRVKVLTRDGERVGVVAVANGHFARQHRGETDIPTVDDLWVDVGASSAAAVDSLGIHLLDPVLADRPAWDYQGYAAGPAAGARASCAAVATAAVLTPSRGETVWVLSTGRSFGWVGLGAALVDVGAFDELVLVDAGQLTARDTIVDIARIPASAVARLARADGLRLRDGPLDRAQVIAPRVRFGGSFVESISTADAGWLLTAVEEAGGVPADDASSTRAWVAPALDTTRVLAERTDDFGGIERTFMRLADLPGVPGHESQVREAIIDALPDWARARVVIDSIGNVIVAAGPQRDSVLFIAHMDEVAFEVESISRDGIVSLARRGGTVTTAWEGQTALLHFEPARRAPLRGVIVPRDSASTMPIRSLSAWFGLDSAQLVARGVRPGLGVTSYKRADRLAGTRITGRATDDRVGSAALIHALHGLNPADLKRRTIFAWSVSEETGLVGARFIGTKHGASLKRVYSVDTFVSSDTPLERPMFAFTPLGEGVVMRGLDDGAMAPLGEMQRIERLAREHDIPLQVGTTHGSTDGTSLTVYGASNVGLSWPGRYSHSPGEVLDLRDMDALVRLVRAVALEP